MKRERCLPMRAWCSVFMKSKGQGKMNTLFAQVYSTQRRGTTSRLLVPKAGTSVAPVGMPHQNNVTVAGDFVFSLAKVRKFFEFQNQDAVNDMRLSWGI